MKKYIATVALVLLSAAVFAWDGLGERVAEFGFNASAGASNNYFALGDFLTDTLVIDLDDIVSSVGSRGLAFTVDEGAGTFFNLNLKKQKLKVGLFLDTVGSGYAAIPQGLLRLIAEGNATDATYSESMDLRGDCYVELGASVSKTMGKYTFSVKPIYFMPVFYADEASASYTVSTASSGGGIAHGSVKIPVYSAMPLSDSGVDASGAVADLLASGGVDLTLGLEYALLRELKVGGTLSQIPIIPARLDNRSLVDAWFDFTVPNLLSAAEAEADLYTSDSDYSIGDSTKDSITILRPFKASAYCVYTPKVLRFVSVSPKLGLAVGYDVWMEGGLKVGADFFNIAKLSLESAYEDQIWHERFGLALNCRVVELDLGVALQSTDFVASFTLAGASAFLGMRFGY